MEKFRFQKKEMKNEGQKIVFLQQIFIKNVFWFQKKAKKVSRFRTAHIFSGTVLPPYVESL